MFKKLVVTYWPFQGGSFDVSFGNVFTLIILSSVRVSEWPLLGKEVLTRLTVCSPVCVFVSKMYS